MSNDHVDATMLAAIAPFTPPDDSTFVAGDILRVEITPSDKLICYLNGEPLPEPVVPSMVIPCPACDGGWRDTDKGTVMCGQCRGTGRVATSGGEA